MRKNPKNEQTDVLGSTNLTEHLFPETKSIKTWIDLLFQQAYIDCLLSDSHAAGENSIEQGRHIFCLSRTLNLSRKKTIK